jgi:ATP-dependent Clp protease ATP-binding subunit ClpC
MEEGRLTDSFGRHVDFRNVILIMTSNIGAEIIKNQTSLGFRKATEEQTYETMKNQLMGEVDRSFRPEFINRVDDIIVFRALTREDLGQIVHLQIAEVKGRMLEHGIHLRLTPPSIEWLIDKGYDPDYGARPLRRAIEKHVEDPLSEAILRGQFKGKNVITVVVKDEELAFEATEEDAVMAAAGDQTSDAN